MLRGVPGDLASASYGLQAALHHDSGIARAHTNPLLWIQTKLTVNAPGDAYEQEANRVAEQVMRMPEPGATARSVSRSPAGVQRRCACGGGCPRCQSEREHADEHLQMKPVGPGIGTATPGATQAPPIVHEVLRSPGQPLDVATRAFMEPRFGRDFGDVRVHTGPAAAESARSVNAGAYTVGRNIVFGKGYFEPETHEGQHLIAHELAHVSQQASGPHILARQTEQYETRGIRLEQNVINQIATIGYWNRKLQEAHFSVAIIPGPLEEQEAVLSVVWQIKPTAPFTAQSSKLITIPHRQGAAQSRDVSYQVMFKPATQGNQGEIDVILVGAGREGVAVNLQPAPSGFTSSHVRIRAAGFPGGSQYWQSHVAEQQRISYWIEKSAGAQYNQLLTITVGQNTTSIQVTGQKDAAHNTVADVVYLGPSASSVLSPPAHYSDQDIEDLKTTDDPLLHDRLGTITGWDTVHADELASVKFLLEAYFKSNPLDPQKPQQKERKGTRNAEVDAIVPISGTTRRVLYTFRFKAANDVEIERVGEEGRDVSLAPQGSLGRVNGFAEHTQGSTESDKVKSLLEWLKGRYKGVTLPAVTASTTVAEVQQNVTAQIQATRTKEQWYDWYQQNYGIFVLTGTQAAEWLTHIRFKEVESHLDLKDFELSELPILETVLERMSDAILKKFKGVRLLRQKKYCEWHPPTKTAAGRCEWQDDIGGVTVGGLSNPTVTIFDQAFVNSELLFLGGNLPSGEDVETEGAETFAHELGHVVSYGAGVKDRFDRLVFVDPTRTPPVLKPQFKAITWYAESRPLREFFAETFALYYSDPKWLQDNWPTLYAFFDGLDKPVSPPPGRHRP